VSVADDKDLISTIKTSLNAESPVLATQYFQRDHALVVVYNIKKKLVLFGISQLLAFLETLGFETR
jgi:hypothetical protein